MPKIAPRFLSQFTFEHATGTAPGGKVDPSLVEIIEQAALPSLQSGPSGFELVGWLRGAGKAVSRELPDGCLAGLWLLAGDLDASHDISQSDPSPEGSFWHGIMHRREGDFVNAKYWFRRVGRHEVLATLAETDYGDPYQFVDRCQRVDATTAQSLAALQWLEWQCLFFFCLRGDTPVASG
jgi:hypothetical protein